MKKIIALLLVGAISLSLSACSLTGTQSSSQPEASATPTAAPEVTASPTVAPEATPAPEVTAAPEDSEAETKDLPKVEGTAEFLKAFEGNEIDTYYITEIGKAASVADMVSVNNKATQAWETLMNTVYDKVIAAVNTDANMAEKISTEQKAWASDVVIKTEEIKAGVKSTGSMANVEISHKIMLIYRERCTELLSILFDKTGEITITMTTADAVG